MKQSSKGVLWIGLYFFLALAPLILLLVMPRPAGREFWREFSVALGFVGLSLMGLQYFPTARLSFLANVFPMDTVYYFHHRLSWVSLGFMLAHPLILILNNPFTLRLFNVLTAPTRATAGVIALLAATILVGTSAQRKQLGLSYEPWRFSHALLAVTAAGLALVHIFGVRNYLAIPAQRIFWIALAILWLGTILYLHVIKPLLMTRCPYRVAEVREERGSTWSLVLEPTCGRRVQFTPGQIAWLTVGTSPFSLRQHPFSFASSAMNQQQVQFAIRELGDFTSTIKSIPVGEIVYLDGPYGTFELQQEEKVGQVYIAGGVGIAPIMSMLRTLADWGDQRSLLLFYGNRSWETISFREEIEELEKRLNLKVVHIIEKPAEGWTGEKGYITKAMLDRYLPPDRKERRYFVCGPLPMLNAAEKILVQLDIPIRQIHSERYEMA